MKKNRENLDYIIYKKILFTKKITKSKKYFEMMPKMNDIVYERPPIKIPKVFFSAEEFLCYKWNYHDPSGI